MCIWSLAIYTHIIWASTALLHCQCLCLRLAAPAWRFVCYTEAVAEGKEPVETDGKKPEPLQAVGAPEPSSTENISNQPQPSGVGVKEQTEFVNSTVKEEGVCSPPPPGKYQSHVSLSWREFFYPSCK